jgi:hypothetical protein
VLRRESISRKDIPFLSLLACWLHSLQLSKEAGIMATTVGCADVVSKCSYVFHLLYLPGEACDDVEYDARRRVNRHGSARREEAFGYRLRGRCYKVGPANYRVRGPLKQTYLIDSYGGYEVLG